MKSERALFKYKNVSYKPEIIEDLKKDTYQVIHWVVSEDGEEFKADYTPYHKMSKGDFEMYVNLGCPVRRSEHPWSHYRLYEAMKKKPEQIEPEINKGLKKKTEKKSATRKTRNT